MTLQIGTALCFCFELIDYIKLQKAASVHKVKIYGYSLSSGVCLYQDWVAF